MMTETIKILLVEDNPSDADMVERALRDSERAFVIDRAGWLSSALMALSNKTFDAILLDMSLPDSQGVDTVVQMMEAVPEMPVIVMTGHDDMETGMNAVKYGVQDYLIKGEISGRVLERSILQAIERKRSDMVGKRLLMASISGVSRGSGNSAGLLSDHVVQLAAFIGALRTYIAKNAPAHVENVEALAAAHDVDVVLREIRSVLQISEPNPRGGSRISDMAMRAMRSASDGRSSTPAEARDALLEVIESSRSMGVLLSGEGNG